MGKHSIDYDNGHRGNSGRFGKDVNKNVKEVSFLENSIYYFVKCAYITQEKDRCRLIVTHQERLLLDRYYSTAKGAKIGFVKRYGYRLWQDGVRPVWTPFQEN
jgi:hypothetical protein